MSVDTYVVLEDPYSLFILFLDFMHPDIGRTKCSSFFRLTTSKKEHLPFQQ